MDDELKHVGVLGMKWGHRKSQSSSRTSRKGRKEATSDDFKAVAQLKKKRIESMSNEEIAKVNKRMDLERKYKEVLPSRVAKGKKATKEILGTVGTVAGGVAGILYLSGLGKTLFERLGPHVGKIMRTANVIDKVLE